jgi:hypothetical protein
MVPERRAFFCSASLTGAYPPQLLRTAQYPLVRGLWHLR